MLTTMKVLAHIEHMSLKHLTLLIVLAIWEGFWLWAYLTAATPDYEMRRPAALLFGGLVPILSAVLIGLAMIFWRKMMTQRQNDS